MSKHISDPKTTLNQKIREWIDQNISLYDAADKIDWDVEINSQWSFSENINSLIDKFPMIWRSEEQRETQAAGDALVAHR